ncbi:Rrf2 family transcriptional regulator [Deferribacter autotrophicus]|uniref:Rrf2 family transcriptional regulator n=1 Tax=Deferribacter autotrophicus TaxID=500465 RepID=A0A5A8F0B4_9BACT|nr:Rrf2 family transcriptional regulator [Deferribacter autotrophicus]KAA0257416.1 Rrf2 family transcriptional regulator [Deferribacter autotrophicus]
MKITRATDYALRVMVFLAKAEKGKVFMRSELSKYCEVPDSFLGKILQVLAKKGLLVSGKGKKGGFKLEKKPDEITLYDIISAVDGEVFINECLDNPKFCSKADSCSINNILNNIKIKFVNDLKSYTLKDFL